MAAQPDELFAPLDAFGGDRQAEAAAEGENGPGDCLRPRARVDAGDEAAIELHPRQRQLLQGRKRRVAGAEVIECDTNANGAQLAQHLDGVMPGLENVLRQLDLDTFGRQVIT
jgi:hypothetical protein